MSADPFDSIIGRSRAAEAMRTFGRRAAAVDAPVLILGESGTGKGVLARSIHQASRRRLRPFVAVNCAAIPESLFESEFFGHVRGAFTGAQYTHKGLFEQAHSGTLFLDEIGELAMPSQAKLLTALEDQLIRRVGAERMSHVDVRIIAATACDLPSQVNAKTFRADLYHRLSILSLEIAPLRSRAEDIPLLAHHLRESIAARYQLPDIPRLAIEACAHLQGQEWPGNVRELANAIERAMLLCNGTSITSEHLTLGIRSGMAASPRPTTPTGARYSFIGTLEQEQAEIRSALSVCRGNKTRAAALLGMSRNTLLNKLRMINSDKLSTIAQKTFDEVKS